MKKSLAFILASAMLVGAMTACSPDEKDDISPVSSVEEEQHIYSAHIYADYRDGVPARDIAYEYVDGKDSIEVYYIFFGCDIDGLTLERIDENGKPTKTLYSTEKITTEQCFKLTTTVPEGFPNSQITAVCGENEYRYQLCFNGRDGGADLIPSELLVS